MSSISDRLEKQADLLFQNVAGWETKALQRIGRRVKEIKSLSYADLQAINNATIVNQDVNAILAELATVTGQNALTVQEVYANMLEEQHLENKPLYDYRNKPFVPLKDNKQMQSIVRAYARTTVKTMVNLSMTKARQIGIADKNGQFIPLEKSFHNILDKAVMSVTTGTGDFHSEMRDVLKELGGSGMRVDYGGGVTRRLDTMVRQNILWGAKQASIEYSDMIGEELGCDGIEIDWHSHPRPSHEFMQGKQYALGKARTVSGIYYESADDALAALEDYGCLHFKFPIILGVSVPTHSKKELARLNAENAKPIEIDGVSKSGYEWKQTMRRLETESRKTREQKELLKASGDKEGVRQLNNKLAMIDARYKRIADVSGLEERRNRMAIVKGNTHIKRNSMHYIKGDVVSIKSGDGSSKMTKELAKELTVEAENFESKIGELKYLKSVKSKRYANNSVWGGYNDNSGELILFGVGGESGKSLMITTAREMKKAGKWSTSSPYHAYRHELTHCWLQSQREVDGFADKIKEIEDVRNDVLGQLTNDEKSDKILMRNKLSTYGLYPSAEVDDFIAECVAEYLNGKPRVVAKNVVEILLRK